MNINICRNIKLHASNLITGISYVAGSFKGPRMLMIELTNHCNADCIMCEREKLTRKKGFMAFSMFKKIIYDAAKSNVKIFQLSFYGEPLLYSNLITCIDYIHKMISNSAVSFITNGNLLTPKYAEKLLASKVSAIGISIDGNNKKEYEIIRKNLNWETLRTNVISIKKIIDENNYSTKIVIVGLNTKQYELDPEMYKATWGDYCDVLYIRNEKCINAMNKEKMMTKYLPCPTLLSTMVILVSGEVRMCSRDWEDDAVVGDLKDFKILEVWKQPTLRMARIKHILGLKKTVKFCRTCRYRMGVGKTLKS